MLEEVDMTPNGPRFRRLTGRLRFQVRTPIDNVMEYGRKVRILQQEWLLHNPIAGGEEYIWVDLPEVEAP